MVYGGVLVVATFKQFLRANATGTALSSIDFPLGPAYLLVPVGLFFMSLLMLLDVRKVRKGQSSLFQEESPSA
jgi:TRAP-type C4-dicarboxylate transport system permease small subunit